LSLGRPYPLPDWNPRTEKAQHVVVQPQLTLELLDHRGFGQHLEHGVRAFPLLARVVRQPALPPVLDFGDFDAKSLEGVPELRQQRSDFLVGGTRIDD